MFTLRNTKGRLSSASLILLAFVLAACPGAVPESDGPSIDGVGEATQDEIGSANGSSSTDEAPEAETDEVTEDAAVSATGAEYQSCHEQRMSGGASDGVLVLNLSGTSADDGVFVQVLYPDTGYRVPVPGRLDASGRAVFVIPLNSFGEVITVDEVLVNGEAIDLSGVGELRFTVEESSDCSNHPANDA